MHICCTKNNGIDYLQVQESYYESINGKSKQRKRVIKNLGPLFRFDDGEANYLYRLRASFRDGKPLIPELNDLVGSPPPPKIKLEFDPNELSDYGSYELVERAAPEGYLNSGVIRQSFQIREARYDRHPYCGF